jgi:hypothetical protein
VGIIAGVMTRKKVRRMVGIRRMSGMPGRLAQSWEK